MDYSFGPKIERQGVTFRLWAPSVDAVDLEVQGMHPLRMRNDAGGWKTLYAPCHVGSLYRFWIGDIAVPDPASRRQAGGVHGWSVVCPEPYHRKQWIGRPWNEAVIYEMHLGLSGGFAGAIKRLDELADLGFTAIELMPIADFPGKHNWGYDGVLPFSPAGAYGSPDHLRMLVDRAHSLDMMVFLDVVYNHFGPDGNYLPLYAEPFFRHDIATAWGPAVDFRQEEVRRFVLENISYWLDEYAMDGLRFDAVHSIEDNGWLDKSVQSIGNQASINGFRRHFILENECNAAERLRSGFTAQWNDDFHHVLHVLLTEEDSGYYKDFVDAPAEKLARALAHGFVYQGEPSTYRGGQPRGTPSAGLDPTAFIAFLHNHDQIGNRAFGERLTVLARPNALIAATALLLLSPQIPLVFMGDEIGSRSPFLYFTDHGKDLAEAVREGRRREFSAFFDRERLRDLPDPNSPRSFEDSDPAIDAPKSEWWRGLYRTLILLRCARIAPYLAGAHSIGSRAIGTKAIIAQWRLNNGERLTIACNLDKVGVSTNLPARPPVWGTSPDLAGETTLAWLEPA